MSLVRAGFIPLPPGAKPGFDHADVYRAGRRMYVAHTGADRVDVLDCEQQAFLRSLPGPARRRRRPDRRAATTCCFTSDRAAARVSVFRCSDEQLARPGRRSGRTRTGSPTTARRRRLYALQPRRAARRELHRLGRRPRLDAASIAELPLPGRPRWAVYDAERDRRLREHPRAGRDRRHRLRAARDRARVRRCPSAGPARALARLAAGSSAPPTAARSSCSTATAARCWRACRCPACRTCVMHDADLRRLYVAIGDPGVVCSFDSDAPRAARDGRDRAGRAHARLGPRRPLPLRLLPEQRRRGRLRGTRLSAGRAPDHRRPGRARRSPTGSARS